MQKIARFVRNRRGQSMVELGLLLPILIWLVLGMMDFGLIIYNYTLMNEAARAGARAAVVGTADDEIRTKVVPNSVGLKLQDFYGLPQILPQPATTRTTGTEVTVKVERSYDFKAPFVSVLFPNASNNKIIIPGKAVMRME